jgi:hypothetical protein
MHSNTWFYRKNELNCDRKCKSKIEETRKVYAAINSFETVFSKNVVCRYFLFFLYQQTCKNKIISEKVESGGD